MIKKFTKVAVSTLTLAMAQGLMVPGLTVSVALAQDAPAPAAGDAQAQAAPQQGGGISDIVVTATRQSTNLQSTPIAITAITSEGLAERAITKVSDLSAIVPNATFRKSQGAFGPGVTAFIRGIGQNDTSLGSEPGVAYYIDDVYYPLLLGSNFDLLDLDHIEVLRGPQGTLFGRNALAGAVNIVSKQPSLTDALAYVEVTTGAYNRMDLRAGFSIPLSSTLGLSISGVSKKRQGYQDRLDFRCEMVRRGTPALAGTFPFASGLSIPSNNFAPDDCVIGHQGGEDVRAIRGSLRWEPTSNVSLTISGDYTQDNSENAADTLLAVPAPAAVGANVRQAAAVYGVAYDNRFVTGNPFQTYASYSDPIAAGTVLPGNTFYNGFNAGVARGGQAFNPHLNLDNWGVSARLVVGLTDDIDLTTVIGHRDLDETHAFDVDGSPIVVEHTLANIGERYTNVEMRLSGKSDLIDWVVGGFYFHGNGFNHALTYSPQNTALRVQNTTYTPTSKAVFANATVHPFEGFNITLGGRYSDDRKKVDFNNSNDTNIGNIIFKVTPQDKRVDWKVGADYHITDTTMVYGSVATGARLPGFNARPLQPSQVVSFPGDETLAYELGLKTDLFDHRLRINATAFYTDYKTRITTVSGQEVAIATNGQPTAGGSILIPLPIGGDGATTCRARTAAEVAANTPGFQCIGRNYYVNTPGKSKGVEFEVTANPVEGLTINANLGYVIFSSADLKVATRANDRLLNVPEWSASVGVQYEIPVEGLQGSITPRLDWFYTGNIVYSASRNDYNQPAFSVFNSRITYSNSEHDFTVSAGATNLFNKFSYRNFFVYQDIGFPNVNGQPAPPREWFLSFAKKF